MMRKSPLVLIIAISTLIFYAGCDDNNGGGGGQAAPTPTPLASPPPGGGVPPQPTPPPRPEACDNCPCPFYDIPYMQPFVDGCWMTSEEVGGSAEFDPGAGLPGIRCSLLVRPPENVDRGLIVFSGIENACEPGQQACCSIQGLSNTAILECPLPEGVEGVHELINDQQVDDCLTCLEGYTATLHFNFGFIPIVGADFGAPQVFLCAPHQ
jgi:hypothetical protein